MYRIERVVKIKREIEDMDRFEEEEMKNIRPIKNTWFDLLINYIFKPINLSALKDIFTVFFKTNTHKKLLWERTETKQSKKKQNTKKPFIVYQKRIKKKIKDRIIRDIRKIFETEKEKEERKELEKK